MKTRLLESLSAMLAVLLTCVFVFGSLPPLAQCQQPTADLSVTPLVHVVNVIGEYYNFYVNINNAQNLHTAKFTIQYNASIFQFYKLVQQPFFPPPPATSFQYKTNGSTGFLTINLTLVNLQASLNGNGTLVYATLKLIQKPTSCIASEIALSQVSLMTPSAKPISYDIAGAICFWKSTGPDPPGPGLIKEYSSKSEYMLGETVNLFAEVTFAGAPIQNKLVAFQVNEPSGQILTILEGLTDVNGVAAVSFSIPQINASIGVWTEFSTVEIDQQVYSDMINFTVISGHPTVRVAPVGGYSFSQTLCKAINPSSSYWALVISFAFAAVVWTPIKRRQKRR
jgi:hypothetical protein